MQVRLPRFPYSFQPTTPKTPGCAALPRRHSYFSVLWSRISTWYEQKSQHSLYLLVMCGHWPRMSPSVVTPVPLKAEPKVRGPPLHTSAFPRALRSETPLETRDWLSARLVFRHETTKVSFRRSVFTHTLAAGLSFILARDCISDGLDLILPILKLTLQFINLDSPKMKQSCGKGCVSVTRPWQTRKGEKT